jgi:hypothetical protein
VKVEIDRNSRTDLEAASPRSSSQGAEVDSHRRLGYGLTHEELKRVLRRYPGDP